MLWDAQFLCKASFVCHPNCRKHEQASLRGVSPSARGPVGFLSRVNCSRRERKRVSSGQEERLLRIHARGSGAGERMGKRALGSGGGRLSSEVCPFVFYSSSCRLLSPLSPPHSPLAIVILFLISMSLVIFCLIFLLLIVFQLKVRSYGICPSLPVSCILDALF